MLLGLDDMNVSGGFGVANMDGVRDIPYFFKMGRVGTEGGGGRFRNGEGVLYPLPNMGPI